MDKEKLLKDIDTQRKADEISVEDSQVYTTGFLSGINYYMTEEIYKERIKSQELDKINVKLDT